MIKENKTAALQESRAKNAALQDLIVNSMGIFNPDDWLAVRKLKSNLGSWHFSDRCAPRTKSQERCASGLDCE